MDITPQTKKLIETIQALKPQYTDPTSTLFIDFYCQCKQGCDYLFPVGVKESVRLIDILNWFLECVDKGEPIPLIHLMWQDIAGPTLSEYQEDEQTEKRLLKAFQSADLHHVLSTWDKATLPSGGVRLILRELLNDIHKLEQIHATVVNA
jgi:hypothetical protein